MKTAVTIFNMLTRICGLILIVLGLLFWAGIATTLIPVHIFFGLVLVLSLWTLAGLAAKAGVSTGLVALAIVWGLIMPILGMTQAQLLVGSAHWVIDALHLLVGVGAVGQAEGLARGIKRAQTAVARA